MRLQHIYRYHHSLQELPPADSARDEDAAIKGNRWNVLLTDAPFLDVGFGPESAYQLLSERPPSSSSSLSSSSNNGSSSSDFAYTPPFQLVNHLPNGAALTSRAGIIRALNRRYAQTQVNNNNNNNSGSSNNGGSQQQHVFDVIPVTYFIPAGSRGEGSNPTLAQCLKRVAACAHGSYDGLRMPPKHCAGNLWVVKSALPSSSFSSSGRNDGRAPPPAGAGSSGSGEMVVVGDALTLRTVLTPRHAEDVVVQKLIERPLLVNGHKTSLRLWVLVSDCGDVWVHDHAYALLAPLSYDVKACVPAMTSAAVSGVQRASHASLERHALSNNNSGGAVGGVMSVPELQSYLDKHAPEGAFPPAVLTSLVLPRIRRIIADAVSGALAASLPPLAGFADTGHAVGAGAATAASAAGAASSFSSSSGVSANPRAGHRMRRCFELLGADFLLDEDLRPWLLGFEPNPTLLGAHASASNNNASTVSPHGPEHARQVHRMAEQAIRLIIDPIFPPPQQLLEAVHSQPLPSHNHHGGSSISSSLSHLPTGSAALSHQEASFTSSSSPSSSAYSPPPPSMLLTSRRGRSGSSSSSSAGPPTWQLVHRNLAAADVEDADYSAAVTSLGHKVCKKLGVLSSSSPASDGGMGGGLHSPGKLTSAAGMHRTVDLAALTSLITSGSPGADVSASYPPRSRDVIPSWALLGPELPGPFPALSWYKPEHQQPVQQQATTAPATARIESQQHHQQRNQQMPFHANVATPASSSSSFSPSQSAAEAGSGVSGSAKSAPYSPGAYVHTMTSRLSRSGIASGGPMMTSVRGLGGDGDDEEDSALQRLLDAPAGTMLRGSSSSRGHNRNRNQSGGHQGPLPPLQLIGGGVSGDADVIIPELGLGPLPQAAMGMTSAATSHRHETGRSVMGAEYHEQQQMHLQQQQGQAAARPRPPRPSAAGGAMQRQQQQQHDDHHHHQQQQQEEEEEEEPQQPAQGLTMRQRLSQVRPRVNTGQVRPQSASSSSSSHNIAALTTTYGATPQAIRSGRIRGRPMSNSGLVAPPTSATSAEAGNDTTAAASLRRTGSSGSIIKRRPGPMGTAATGRLPAPPQQQQQRGVATGRRSIGGGGAVAQATADEPGPAFMRGTAAWRSRSTSPRPAAAGAAASTGARGRAVSPRPAGVPLAVPTSAAAATTPISSRDREGTATLFQTPAGAVASALAAATGGTSAANGAGGGRSRSPRANGGGAAAAAAAAASGKEETKRNIAQLMQLLAVKMGSTGTGPNSAASSGSILGGASGATPAHSRPATARQQQQPPPTASLPPNDLAAFASVQHQPPSSARSNAAAGVGAGAAARGSLPPLHTFTGITLSDSSSNSSNSNNNKSNGSGGFDGGGATARAYLSSGTPQAAAAAPSSARHGLGLPDQAQVQQQQHTSGVTSQPPLPSSLASTISGLAYGALQQPGQPTQAQTAAAGADRLSLLQPSQLPALSASRPGLAFSGTFSSSSPLSLTGTLNGPSTSSSSSSYTGAGSASVILPPDAFRDTFELNLPPVGSRSRHGISSAAGGDMAQTQTRASGGEAEASAYEQAAAARPQAATATTSSPAVGTSSMRAPVPIPPHLDRLALLQLDSMPNPSHTSSSNYSNSNSSSFVAQQQQQQQQAPGRFAALQTLAREQAGASSIGAANSSVMLTSQQQQANAVQMLLQQAVQQSYNPAPHVQQQQAQAQAQAQGPRKASNVAAVAPAPVGKSSAAAPPATAAEAAASLQVHEDLWIAVPNPSGGQPSCYYYNSVTKATSWSLPSGPGVVVIPQADIQQAQAQQQAQQQGRAARA